MGSIIRAIGYGRERGRLFRKTEVGGWHFRFLVVFGSGISEFAREMAILGLVRRLQQSTVFEIKPQNERA